MSRIMGPPCIDGRHPGDRRDDRLRERPNPGGVPWSAIQGGQITAVRQRCQELYDAVRQEAPGTRGRRGGEPGFETGGFRLERARPRASRLRYRRWSLCPFSGLENPQAPFLSTISEVAKTV